LDLGPFNQSGGKRRTPKMATATSVHVACGR
jgi:hypothetical protein